MNKVLIFGGSGLVGSRFIQLNKKVFKILAPDISEVDILKVDQINRVFNRFKPDIVINFAAFTDVQASEKQKGDKDGICYQINAIGAKNVAKLCKSWSVHLIYISTDYVFDGRKKSCPYTELDKPNPINWYGQTKYFGDKFVLESGSSATIARISMPYSARYEAKIDIARFFMDELKRGFKIRAIEDQKITPTLVDDIANVLKEIANKKSKGIYHVSATNDTSPFEFAKLLAQKFGFDTSNIEPISLDEYNQSKIAPLLKFSWLDPSKFVSEFGEGILHTVEEEVKLFKSQII